MKAYITIAAFGVPAGIEVEASKPPPAIMKPIAIVPTEKTERLQHALGNPIDCFVGVGLHVLSIYRIAVKVFGAFVAQQLRSSC